MFSADVLTFREFMMGEPLPLATLQQVVLEFLRRARRCGRLRGAGRECLCERATHDARPRSSHRPTRSGSRRNCVPICGSGSTLPCAYAVSVEGGGCVCFRCARLATVTWWTCALLRPYQERNASRGVLVLAPADLIASKVVAYYQRRGQPKSGTDWRDLAMLLLTFPALKCDPGPVGECLQAAGAAPEVLAAWQAVVAQDIRPPEEDEEF